METSNIKDNGTVTSKGMGKNTESDTEMYAVNGAEKSAVRKTVKNAESEAEVCAIKSTRQDIEQDIEQVVEQGYTQQWMLLLEAQDRDEALEALGFTLQKFTYYLYHLKEKAYRTNTIVKKRGGTRTISAPMKGLKRMQRRVADVLSVPYCPKRCVHGFVPKRGIITNAGVHTGKRFVINLDLKDFFPSIHIGRVIGALTSEPFGLQKEVAVTLAQICTFQGVLPQGAPSSPILSNIICRSLDNALLSLAKECRADYTRYADDITISTNRHQIPDQLGKIEGECFVPSARLRQIIEDAGFVLNEEKTRYSTAQGRVCVTGLVVNEKVNVPRFYIRRVRAILHSWEKFGIEQAAKEHFAKFSPKRPSEVDLVLGFKRKVAGMIGYIGMVKGKESSVYKSFAAWIKRLAPDVPLLIPPVKTGARMVVFCEGKTDPLHLDAALNYFRNKGEYTDLSVFFYIYHADAKISNSTLWKHYSEKSNFKEDAERIEVYLFDSDDKEFVNKVCGNDRSKLFSTKGKNIYAAILPKPAHRDFDNLCIEHFYSDEDLFRVDSKGRRLYFSVEFDSTTGIHKENTNLRCISLKKLKSGPFNIIDSDVRNEHDTNVALSKNEFARAVTSNPSRHRSSHSSHSAIHSTNGAATSSSASPSSSATSFNGATNTNCSGSISGTTTSNGAISTNVFGSTGTGTSNGAGSSNDASSSRGASSFHNPIDFSHFAPIFDMFRTIFATQPTDRS